MNPMVKPSLKHPCPNRHTVVALVSLFVLLGWCGILPARGQRGEREPSIQVRMLLADNSGDRSSVDLEDILPLLQKNLRFSSYRLVGQALTRARASTHRLPFGYTLDYTKVSLPTLTVSISRRDETLLRTRLHLLPGRPVIVGGFPHARSGTVILVLELHSDRRLLE